MRILSLPLVLGWLVISPVPGWCQEKLDLRVLYVGGGGGRARSYGEFLAARFKSARVAERSSFDPKSAADADVVLLDWPQNDERGKHVDLKSVKSPFGDRAEWSRPTVLLGSAGLIIAGPWQTFGSWG